MRLTISLSAKGPALMLAGAARARVRSRSLTTDRILGHER